MLQLKEGYTPPNLSEDNFIKPIKPKRAQDLATHALHFSMRIAAMLSLDHKGTDLKQRVQTWYQASGYKYVMLDPKANPCLDEMSMNDINDEFEEET